MIGKTFGYPDSVRLRLILGNTAILGLILFGLAAILRVGAEIWLARELDQDMATFVQPMVTHFSTGFIYRLREQVAIDNIARTNTPFFERTGDFVPLVLDRDQRRFVSGKPGVPYDQQRFTLALRGVSSYSTRRSKGKAIRVLSIPLVYKGEIRGVLQMARPLEGVERQLNRLTGLLLMVFPLALIASGVGGLYLTARVLHPVRAITLAAASIEARDLSGRLPVSGNDEFAELSLTFNAMLGRLEESFAQQRRFTADASHELRTPLAALTGDVSLALSAEREAEGYRQTLVAVSESAGRMHRIVQDLLLLARSEEGHLPIAFELLSLAPLLRRVAMQVQGTTILPISLELPASSDVPVVGDAHYLERLFLNLLDNALRYSSPEQEVVIALHYMGGNAVVRVIDTGEGIAREHLPHIFERFYRADASRARRSGGTGLGLTICKSIVEVHRGTITIDSALKKGTTVTVTLPEAIVT